MNPRQRILVASDRAICALIAMVILGGTLGFGGAVWWFRPGVVVAVFLLVSIKLASFLAVGSVSAAQKPAHVSGTAGPVLGVVQLAPLPASLALRLSPVAHDVYAAAVLPAWFTPMTPKQTLPAAIAIRSPASLDRSATLRRLVSAAACLGIFWAVSHFTDRLGRLYLVWGVIIAGFMINAALAIVQITNRSDGLYGLFVPGRAAVLGAFDGRSSGIADRGRPSQPERP